MSINWAAFPPIRPELAARAGSNQPSIQKIITANKTSWHPETVIRLNMRKLAAEIHHISLYIKVKQRRPDRDKINIAIERIWFRQVFVQDNAIGRSQYEKKRCREIIQCFLRVCRMRRSRGALGQTTEDITFRPIGSNPGLGRELKGKRYCRNCWLRVFGCLS